MLADVSWHGTNGSNVIRQRGEPVVDERQVRYREIIVTQEFTA